MGDYALALVDLELPDRSGITLVRALRRAGHTMPTIILTGRGGGSLRADELRVGELTMDGVDRRVRAGTRELLLRARLEEAGGAPRLETVRGVGFILT